MLLSAFRRHIECSGVLFEKISHRRTRQMVMDRRERQEPSELVQKIAGPAADCQGTFDRVQYTGWYQFNCFTMSYRFVRLRWTTTLSHILFILGSSNMYGYSWNIPTLSTILMSEDAYRLNDVVSSCSCSQMRWERRREKEWYDEDFVSKLEKIKIPWKSSDVRVAESSTMYLYPKIT